MRLSEISKKPKIGKCYRLRNGIGDYSNAIVYVEQGPRNQGTSSEQYRVSTGPNNYDVDWIETILFDNSIEVPEPAGIRYASKTEKF